MEKVLNRIHELRDDPKVGFVSAADSDIIEKGGMIGMCYLKAFCGAVMKNKKFRAVLEYDPEEKKSVFYITFDEPGIRLEV